MQPLIGSRILALREQRVMFDADLAELEDKTEALARSHDTFSRNARNPLEQVFDALRDLMTPPDPRKRPIGFINAEGRVKKISGARSKT